MVNKAPKIFSVLLMGCLSCHSQATYSEIEFQSRDISNLTKGYFSEVDLVNPDTIQYGETGSLVNLYSGKVYSFLSSMQKIVDLGEDAEELNFSSYNFDMLLRNQMVLQEIIEHPEYLESVVKAYPYRDPESAISEMRLIHIVPMSNGQYILGFLTSTGMVPEAVYFLFSIENGIEDNPLIFTAIDSYRSQTVDSNQLQTFNIEDSLAVSGGAYYDYKKENDYFYFLDGKRSRAYSSLKYSLINGQLVLEEQITGVRQMSESNDFAIVHFVRQANQFTNVSSIECQSSIAFSDIQDGSSLVDACEREDLSD